MDSIKKTEQVNVEYEKCRDIIKRAITSKNVEKALASISIASALLYSWNQRYTDDFLEKAVSQIAEMTITHDISTMSPNKEVILFYDGFGLDTRGLALIYLKALSKIEGKKFYIAPAIAKNNQPEIDKILKAGGIEKIYYSSLFYEKRLEELQNVISKIKPGKAFLYTGPNDSTGIALFMQMKKTKRYMINLTDHAFWLGVHAFDYCLEFRNLGASISKQERGIDPQKQILLPYYPSINKDVEFQGWPFDVKDNMIIFSGGALYKTINKERTYYKIVSELLYSVRDCIFVYAGSGDDKWLKELANRYPGRVYHIQERKDLYQVMLHSTIYLNTYPLIGGLMMQYAAAAGIIPITLLHGSVHSGILIDQENRNIEYKTSEELVSDTIKLLENQEYRKKREGYLKGSLISERVFNYELRNVINNNTTTYKISYCQLDTKKYRDEYAERFDMSAFLLAIANKNNLSLFMNYRGLYVKRLWRKINKQ